jgi:hypothetical protein
VVLRLINVWIMIILQEAGVIYEMLVYRYFSFCKQIARLAEKLTRWIKILIEVQSWVHIINILHCD